MVIRIIQKNNFKNTPDLVNALKKNGNIKTNETTRPISF